MNLTAHQKICELFDSTGADYRVYEHPVCRSSEESMAVRKSIGIDDAIGAKALLCKLYWRNTSHPAGPPSSRREGLEEFATIVLPGTHVLDKVKFKETLPLKMFRFATTEELMDIAGVEYGCMPPFGHQIFEKITRFYVSSELKDFPRVAFNAAYLEKSIVLSSADYFSSILPDAVFDFSTLKS